MLTDDESRWLSALVDTLSDTNLVVFRCSCARWQPFDCNNSLVTCVLRSSTWTQPLCAPKTETHFISYEVHIFL